MFDSFINILSTFVFVLASIVAFIAPFYFVYRYRLKDDKNVEDSISQRAEDFFLSKESNYLVFVWAMGEALFWFVIPEFLLLLVVFMRVKRKRQLVKYDVVGTIAGTLIAFQLHLTDGAISKLSFIQPKMIEQTAQWYNDLGVFGLIYQPFSGVPYKVFTLTANRYDFQIIGFIIVAVVVRMSRYVIFFGLFNALYPGLHKFVYKNYVLLLLVATFIFSMSLVRVVNTFS